MARVNGAAVAVAIRIHRVDETAAEGGVGTQACQPQDDHEEVQRQNRPRVIAGAASCRVLGKDRIQRDDPRQDALFEDERLAIEHETLPLLRRGESDM